MLKQIRIYLIALFSSLLFFGCDNQKNFKNYDGDKVFISTLNHKFISCRYNENNTIQANGIAPNEWETFYIEKTSKNIHLRTRDGLYIGSNNNSQILATKTTAQETEAFIYNPYKEYFTLSTPTGKNVIVDENGYLKVSQSNKPEIFKLITQSQLNQPTIHIGDIDFFRFFLQLISYLLILYLFFRFFKKKSNYNSFSTYTLLIIGFIWAYVIIHQEHWKNNAVITSDTTIYYEYLPAAIIFNDLSFEFVNNLPDDFNGAIWLIDTSTKGKKAPKFTMGLSLMYLPFFLVGHVVANILNYSTYGYSLPYFILICIGTWIYAFIGLYYLRKILGSYFGDKVVGLTLISIALATNLFSYVTQDTAMTHAYSFFLFSVFIWNTIRWYEQKQLKQIIIIGLTFGLITLIRPTNAIIAIFFILFGISTLGNLKERLSLFWKYKIHVLTIALISCLIWSPQLILWKIQTNNWLYFSYGKEGFFFNNPRIFDGLFSYRKGWLVYTPIMIFSILGLYFLFKSNKNLLLPISLFLIINIYIVYSWWCWWYGGGFGSRPMIDSYALMAIPLAAFFSYLLKKTSFLKWLPLPIILLLMVLNLFQTLQTKSCLHYDSMTKEAYWYNFTKTGWSEDYEQMIKPPNYEKALIGEDEY